MFNGLTRFYLQTLLTLLAFVLSGCTGPESADAQLPGDPVELPPEQPGNTAPTISGTPSEVVTVGQNYSFTPDAMDDDGDTLVFLIENRPEWLDFDTVDGTLSGLARSEDEGLHENIVIFVTDGSATTGLPPFAVTVSEVVNPGPPPPPGNSAPTINGSAPRSVDVGQTYSFTPEAADADDDELEFLIENQPTWLDFNTTDGTLSGMPASNDAGPHRNIIISVTDGTDSTELAPFTITVNEVVNPGPPPTDAEYVGFGTITQGADSCPTTVTTYHVTSLSGAGGSGTLRDAVSADCRLVVFDIAGTIDLGDLKISNSYLTIDGSTAPEPGITLTNVGRLVLEATNNIPVHDVIVNNIRAIGRGGSIEANDLWELDGSSGAPVHNVILDHLTMQAAGDGNVDIYGDVYNVTLSNSLITDSIQGHHFSQASGLRERISIYGNVYARLNERQPRIRYNTRQLDYVGNVIYGWGWFEGGAAGMHIDVGNGDPSANVENNTYLYVSGLSGNQDEGLKIDDLSGSWFFANNTWPSGESTGDTTSTSGRVSTVFQGIDYLLPRTSADILNAGTHYKTADEQSLLQTIESAFNSN